MGSQYEFDVAAGYSLAQLATVVTEAFRGYPQPVYESAGRLSRLVRVHSLDLAHSLVIRAPNGELIGISFLGLRNTRAWISAFGIVPAHRGRGLARRLLGRILEQARAAGALDVRLEVLTTNAAARHIYAKGGFTVARDLVCLERDPRHEPAPPVPTLMVEQATVDEAVENARALEQTPPCWQREAASLVTGSGLALLALSGGRVVGCALYSRRDSAVALHHLAARSNLREHVVDALLPRIGGAGPNAPSRHITLLNEPQPGGLVSAYLARGFKETIRQLELFRGVP